jgi:hypothetical protein
MKLLYEDLQFWNETTNRQFIHIAYEKAKKIFESGYEPLIDWCESSYIDVQKGPPLKTTSFKKFKQSKIKSLHSKKKNRRRADK